MGVDFDKVRKLILSEGFWKEKVRKEMEYAVLGEKWRERYRDSERIFVRVRNDVEGGDRCKGCSMERECLKRGRVFSEYVSGLVEEYRGEGIPLIGGRVFFVGEALGFEEREKKRVFCGKAGYLLRGTICAVRFASEEYSFLRRVFWSAKKKGIFLHEEEDLFWWGIGIGNVLKGCPTSLKKGREAIRQPNQAEIERCSAYLAEEILDFCPENIVLLGKTALLGFWQVVRNWQKKEVISSESISAVKEVFFSGDSSFEKRVGKSVKIRVGFGKTDKGFKGNGENKGDIIWREVNVYLINHPSRIVRMYGFTEDEGFTNGGRNAVESGKDRRIETFISILGKTVGRWCEVMEERIRDALWFDSREEELEEVLKDVWKRRALSKGSKDRMGSKGKEKETGGNMARVEVVKRRREILKKLIKRR